MSIVRTRVAHLIGHVTLVVARIGGLAAPSRSVHRSAPSRRKYWTFFPIFQKFGAGALVRGIDHWTSRVGLGIEGARFQIVEVLTWVDGFEFKRFYKIVETGRHKSSKEGADPVDPVFGRELAIGDAWAEGSRGV